MTNQWETVFFRFKRYALSCMPDCRIGNSVIIKFSSSVKYLLVCIHETITDNEDIKRQMKYLCGTANWLKTNFAKSSKRVKNFLFKQHCTMFYASQMWCKQYLNYRGEGGVERPPIEN